MDEQTMQPKSKEPKTPPNIEAAQFVPDPALDALYRQAVAVSKEFGWPLPVRAHFEARYRAEIAASSKKSMSEPQPEVKLRKRKKPPEGMVPERTLRSLIRTIAMEIRKDGLTRQEKLALLRQQQRLANQLRESVAATAAQ